MIALPAANDTSARAESFRSRLVEFMLVGGATLVLLPLAWLLRTAIGLDDSELAVSFTAFYAAWVINDPHFAVTYLLFYKDMRKRTSAPDLSLAQRILSLIHI